MVPAARRMSSKEGSAESEQPQDLTGPERDSRELAGGVTGGCRLLRAHPADGAGDSGRGGGSAVATGGSAHGGAVRDRRRQRIAAGGAGAGRNGRAAGEGGRGH